MGVVLSWNAYYSWGGASLLLIDNILFDHLGAKSTQPLV